MLIKLIVCLTGMPGAGKSTIADGLKPKGYDIINMGNIVREEAKKRNLEATRENLGKLMLELREKNGPGAIAELVKPQIESSISDVVLIDGVRSNDEIQVLRKFGTVKLLAIHASTNTRFDFLQKRGRTDDPQTIEHFEERDNRELGVGISNSIALSDYAISNVGLTKDELIESTYKIIQSWIK
ncbi:MAG: AAA family ATPase [Nitrosopumilus sp.]|nr:AAA family ATPase [Nitrosopumilus sp.]